MSKALVLEMDDIVKNEIAEYTDKLNACKDGDLHPELFQKRRLWQGIYGQRQPDVNMIRIKIPYGLANTNQLRATAKLSEKYSNGILHITTRAAVQLHFLQTDETPDLLTDLAESGLTSREACGNVIRAITADPYAGIGADQAFNVFPLAEYLFIHCLRNPYAQNFPRKFKISFSGNEETDLGLAFMHDVGFVAVNKDGEYRLKLYAGGGLGGVPIGAELVEEDLPIGDALIATTALMRIFNEFGNRENRNKARLKFVKKTWGFEKFRDEYKKEFNRIKESEYGQSLILDIPKELLDLPTEKADKATLAGKVDADWLDKCVAPQNTVDTFAVRVRIRLGDLTHTQLTAICDLTDKYGNGEIRTTVKQNILIPNIKGDDLAALREELKALNEEYVSTEYYHITNVVACPGRSTCNLSVTSSKGLASAIIDKFAAEPTAYEGAEDVQINISGCHNGCGQHAVAGIGFNGSSRMVDGRAVPCANIMIGGGADNGRMQMGRRLGRVAAQKAPDAIGALIAFARENAPEGQSVDDYLATVAPKELKAVIKPFDTIESYEAEPEVFRDYQMEEGEEYSPAVGMGECAGGVMNLVTEALDDSKNYLDMAQDVLGKGFYKDVAYNTREAVRHTMRAALIEAGETHAEFNDCWDSYTTFFGAKASLPARPEIVKVLTETVSQEEAEAIITAGRTYCETITALYAADKENLKPVLAEELGDDSGEATRFLDLAGVACPMNYVKAKLALEQMEAGSSLEVIIDSGMAFRTVPTSLQKDGHKIAQLAPINDEEQYSLIVIKDGGTKED